MEQSSAEIQQRIPKPTEGELPESRMFDLLSSVGNAEHKAAELIVMRQGVIYSRTALYHEIMDHQRKDKAWRMDRSTPFQHCQASLSPIGLVTREALSPDGSTWGYQITEFGLNTGKSFAGLLLKWSYEHPNHSLYKMLGSTNSRSIKDEQTLGKKRAQETRYKIFWEIATNPNNKIRLKDIADGINENPINIGLHLRHLSKSSLIAYDVAEKGKSSSHFRFKVIVSDQKPEQYKTDKALSAVVYDLLTHEYLSVGEISDRLIKKYSEYEILDRKSLNGNIARILTYFEKQGYIERKKFSAPFRSEVTMSDEQREAILTLVTIIDKFKNGDSQTIGEGRRFAQKVSSDPNLFSELMLKAKDSSFSANKVKAEEMNSNLLFILQEHPNSTTNQIMQILEEDYDSMLTLSAIRRNLSRLAQKDMITSEPTKSGNVYKVVDSDNQAIRGS